jgi:flagellar biosynthetic protein FliO
MPITGPTAASNDASVRPLDGCPTGSGRRPGSGRRVATIACVAALAALVLIGTLQPILAAGGAKPGSGASAAVSSGSAWGGGDAIGGVDWPDLVLKGTIVLALLFITLRVLGRTGAGAPKRGGRLEVLESRALAPKASLHLVAVGDRRLVVGLTPSGMVSLAELDATELETEAAAATAEESTVASDAFGVAGPNRRLGGAAQPTLGSAVDAILRPLDAATGRLATFLNGGRAR